MNKKSFNKKLLIILFSIILVIGVFCVVFLTKRTSNKKLVEISGGAEIHKLDSTSESIFLQELIMDPSIVSENTQQKFILKVKDKKGIQSMKASIKHDLGRDEKKMSLADGNRKEGSWVALWNTHSLSKSEYDVIFTITNTEGEEKAVTLFFKAN